jgi:hypothetical protein
MDRGFFMRLCAAGTAIERAPEISAARFRLHSDSKTVSQSDRFHGEQRILSRRFLRKLPWHSCPAYRERAAEEDIAEILSLFIKTGGRVVALHGLSLLPAVSLKVFLSRMFWGALKRVIFSSTNRSSRAV